ncbi:uncharacterized protein LOC144428327 [Styela clava]
MEMACYANVENVYETVQAASRPPSIPKQDNNEATNKKTLFVVAISFGICFLLSVAAFILLIMQLQNEMNGMREKLDKLNEIDSSLASNINDTQKQQLENFEKLTTQLNFSLAKISNETQTTSTSIKYELEIMKTKVSQLDSKILIGDKKLKANLTEASSNIDKLLSIIGWFRASNNLIYKRFTDSVNYTTAKAICEGMGARLVSTGIRNNQVKNEIFTKHYLTGAYAWIGLDDISNEGVWIWSDGVNDSPSAIWAPGEPTGGFNEDCAIMLFWNSKLVVYDGGCTDSYRFVCEKDFA